MSRIASTFAGLKGKRPALIGFVTAGFPDGKTCLRLALALMEHCDILEIGIPFSDPVMDGPVLQETAHLALENGFRPDPRCKWRANFRVASEISATTGPGKL